MYSSGKGKSTTPHLPSATPDDPRSHKSSPCSTRAEVNRGWGMIGPLAASVGIYGPRNVQSGQLRSASKEVRHVGKANMLCNHKGASTTPPSCPEHNVPRGFRTSGIRQCHARAYACAWTSQPGRYSCGIFACRTLRVPNTG